MNGAKILVLFAILTLTVTVHADKPKKSIETKVRDNDVKPLIKEFYNNMKYEFAVDKDDSEDDDDNTKTDAKSFDREGSEGYELDLDTLDDEEDKMHDNAETKDKKKLTVVGLSKDRDDKIVASKILNSKQCGKPAISEHLTRIVGGQEAVPHSLPWQAALIIKRTYFSGRTSKHLYCGGSLIAHDWVITAAHCARAKYPVEGMRVYLGVHNIGDKSEKSRVVRRVTHKYLHPNYDQPTTDYDIALLHLDKPVEFNKYIAPICLPSQGHRMTHKYTCLISGWGTLSFHGDPSRVLEVIAAPLVDRNTCNQPRSYNGEVTQRMICAGYREGGMDACQGDSGGPMSCLEDGSDRWTLTGITSWGSSCAKKYKYGVYTNVQAFRNWIDHVVATHTKNLPT